MKRLMTISTIMMVLGTAMAGDDYFNKSQFVLVQASFGLTEPDTDSEIYSYSSDELTFSGSDLEGSSGSFNVLYQLNNFFSVGGGVSVYHDVTGSQYRYFEYENGDDIPQDTRLDIDWFGVQVMITPFGSGEKFGSSGWAPKRLIPYLTLGAGLADWEFGQEGEFVDNETLDIYFEIFEDSGITFSGQLAAGLRLNLHRNVDLDINYSRTFAEDSLAGDFEGFGDIDVSTESARLGVIMRF